MILIYNGYIKPMVGEDIPGGAVLIGDDGKISLSIKKAMDPPPRTSRSAPRHVSPGRPGGFEWQSTRNESGNFEEMMSRFKQTSDEKMSDLKRSLDSKHGGFSKKPNRQG